MYQHVLCENMKLINEDLGTIMLSKLRTTLMCRSPSIQSQDNIILVFEVKGTWGKPTSVHRLTNNINYRRFHSTPSMILPLQFYHVYRVNSWNTVLFEAFHRVKHFFFKRKVHSTTIGTTLHYVRLWFQYRKLVFNFHQVTSKLRGK